MSNANFDNLWILMSKYRFIPDSDSIQNDLTCLICKQLLIDSFQSGCGCLYCHKCIQEYLGGESTHCPGNKRECKEEYLLLDVNVFRNAMLNKKLSKLKFRCPNESCQCIEELSRMEDHLRLCIKEKVDCPYVLLGCDNGGRPKDEISIHLSQDTLSHSHLLLEFIQKMKNDVDKLKEDLEVTKSKVSSLEGELVAKEIKMKEIVKEIESLKRDSTENETRIKKRMMTMDTELGTEQKKWRGIEKTTEENVSLERVDAWTLWKGNVGETFFGVDRFSVRKTQNGGILSPYFYSHTKGYKLRLQVDPEGNGRGKGTHLSVFSVICKGEFDDMLPWPCKHSIQISLIDQSNQKEHYSRTFSLSTVDDEDKQYFDKPIDKDNIGLGSGKFVSLEDLRSIVGLSLNDVIVLKCTVKAPP